MLGRSLRRCWIGELSAAHWFAYSDSCALGNPNANNQVGFVDVVDNPYNEITTASRKIARRMYQVRTSKRTQLENLASVIEGRD